MGTRSFGGPWFKVDPKAEEYGEPEYNGSAPKVSFPDMSARKGDLDHIMSRSGMIVVNFPKSSP